MCIRDRADAGYIQPAYIDSLLKREQVANTFLGSGVALSLIHS